MLQTESLIVSLIKEQYPMKLDSHNNTIMVEDDNTVDLCKKEQLSNEKKIDLFILS